MSPNKAVVLSVMVPAQYIITQAEYNLVRRMKGDRVGAITFLRDQYQLSLRIAKDLVDHINDSQSTHLGDLLNKHLS